LGFLVGKNRIPHFGLRGVCFLVFYTNFGLSSYFAKNLFYFQTSEVSGSSDDNSGNRFITLCPQGYNPKQIRLSNIEYRVRKWGDNPNMQKWKEGAEKEEYHYCSSTDFE
ncbi:MAG: hypothetical protein FWF77_04895, partial [Defluviitaleaceae bacterium]|nr:hypothetical protein [Defluviitaleaceae bacterium]